jgi:hypothetical protein
VKELTLVSFFGGSDIRVGLPSIRRLLPLQQAGAGSMPRVRCRLGAPARRWCDASVRWRRGVARPKS